MRKNGQRGLTLSSQGTAIQEESVSGIGAGSILSREDLKRKRQAFG